MIKDCHHSYRLGNDEGLPIVKCQIKTKGNAQVFLRMKEAYEGQHRGQSMSYNDNCEYAYNKEGQKDCPYYEPKSTNKAR